MSGASPPGKVRGASPLALILALALVASPALAEPLPPLRVRPLVVDGFVTSFAQTPDGLLWIGTRRGLRLFDGVTLREPDPALGDLRAQAINALSLTPDGALWIGTNAGLRVLPAGAVSGPSASVAGRVRAVPLPGPVPAPRIAGLAVDPTGALWVAAATGVLRRRDGLWTHFGPDAGLPAAEATSLVVGADRAIVVSTTVGTARLVGERWERLGEPLEKTNGRRENLGAILPASLAPPCAGPLALLCTRLVRTLLVDRRGWIWVGTSGGLVIWDGAGARLVGAREGLPDEHVEALVEDREGGVWVATHGGAAARVFAPATYLLNVRDGLGGDTSFSVVESVEQGLPRVWVSTVGGLSRHDGRGFTTFARGEAVPKELPLVLAAGDGGAVWAATLRGPLYRFDPGRADAGRVTTLALPPPAAGVTALRQVDGGVLWIALADGRLLAAREGVGSGPGATAPKVSITATPWKGAACPARSDFEGRPCTTAVRVILPRRAGGHWLATFGDGLWIAEAGSFRREALPELGRVMALLEDEDGALWIGTRQGLWRVEGGRARRFGVAEGLPEDEIADLVEDGAGDLVLSTCRGIARVDRRALALGERPPVVRYDARDGLASDCMAAAPPGALRDRSGRLWFASTAGVAVIEPGAGRAASPLSVLVDAVEGHGVRRALAASLGELPEVVELPPGDGGVAVTITVPALESPHQLSLRRRVLGDPAGWSTASALPADRVIRFAGLSSGSQTVEIEAVLAHVRGRRAVARVALVLRPPFVRTPAFVALLGAVTLALGTGALVWRRRALHARTELLADERARIARDLHDSLAQVFSALGLHLDNLARRLGREGQPAPEIGHLRQMLRYGRRASRAVVWNLRARGGAPDSLARALGELGSLYEGTPIEVVVEGTPYALGAEAEHELLSVAQEAVSNAVEHGQAAHVRIELEYARERFALWVRDDGRGTDASPGQGIPGHHGLVGMRERAARARGTLSFESSPDVGTEIGVVIDNPRSSGAPPA